MSINMLNILKDNTDHIDNNKLNELDELTELNNNKLGVITHVNFIDKKIIDDTNDIKTPPIFREKMPVQAFQVEDIPRVIEYLLSKPERYKGTNVRNVTIFIVGINILKRGGDLVALKWSHFFNDDGQMKTHLTVRAQKNKKNVTVAINDTAKIALESYMKSLSENNKKFKLDDPVFPSRVKDANGGFKSMTRDNLWKIIQDVKDALEIEAPMGTHSIRKTLPNQILRDENNMNNPHIIATIVELLGHKDFNSIKHYLGITQKEKDEVLMNVDLGLTINY